MIKKRRWSKRDLDESDFERFMKVLEEEHIVIELSLKNKIRFVYDPHGPHPTGPESREVYSQIWWYELTYKSVQMRFNMSRSQWERFMHYLMTHEGVQ